MTAADIAFIINDGNVAINAKSIHWQAGDFMQPEQDSLMANGPGIVRHVG